MRLNQFLMDEGALLALRGGAGRSEGGTVFSTGGRPPAADAKEPLASVVITPEHYNRIARLIAKNIPVKLEFEVQSKFTDVNDSVNVIGEIPGTGKNKDQIVMVGAHLDSWHGGTGATDNAAGSAVMMEVMRILKQADLKLDRTVRIGLWSGEEQGLLGSRAYVKERFADPATMKITAEHAKFSGYFNIDNGTGKVRGVYLQGNDMMRPIFESWFAPLKDLGVSAITNRNTTGTDHLSFDAVGLPGFQFIQDPIEYDSRTHHSNMDVYDRIQRGDMMQMAAVVATCVYHTANRDEPLPRKPLPKPQPPQGQSSGNAPATGQGARNQ
jgi:Zn-dependent M28 family amino/carboxypeptidase